MLILLRVVCIVAIIVVMMCLWKTAEFFNGLSDMHKYRGVIAWDLLVLFFVLVGLIIKLVTI